MLERQGNAIRGHGTNPKTSAAVTVDAGLLFIVFAG